MKDTGRTIHGIPLYSDPEVAPNMMYMLTDEFKNEQPRRNGTLTDISQPIDAEASITFLYPNDTSVTIRGDGDILKQLVDRLDGQVIDYTVKLDEDLL